ncbi:cytochrome b [Pseudomonas sp.]|uniref:cytochrome b n=1 Tax=Pseudomonas sp. TaxID=306 RepID=UPI003BB5C7C3
MLRNTEDTYGSVSRALHWLMALLIIGMLAGGFLMGEFGRDNPLRPVLYSLHKSTGSLLLLLIGLRLLWTLVNPKPRAIGDNGPANLLAKGVHIGLYVLMIGLPLSGYLLVALGTSTKPFEFYGLFPLPKFSPNGDVREIAEELHENLPWFAIALIGLHIAGGLKRHFIERDGTLARMWRS